MQTHTRLNLFTLVLAAIGLLAVLAAAMLFLMPLGLLSGEAAPPEANYQPPVARATSTVLPTPFRPRAEPTAISLLVANTSGGGGVLQSPNNAPNSAGEATPGAQASIVPNPPAEGQGGTCIGAHVIDRYEQALGEGLEIVVTPIAPEGNAIRLKTDKNGATDLLRNLPGGRYRVEAIVPDEYRPYTAAVVEVTLSGVGEDCARVRFKLEALACLIVIKIDERGYLDLPHPVGLPGWEMTATQGGTQLKRTTDGQGNAVFANIAPGQWVVSEENKLGWEFVTTIPIGPNPAVAILDSPRVAGTCKTLFFVNRQTEGSIVVIKQDEFGNRLPNWLIVLRRVDGTQPERKEYTDKNGQAFFRHVTPGQWEVEEILKADWQAVGDSKVVVEIKQHGEQKQVTFTNQPLGCVDGYKINHLEEGLGGWQIEARKGDQLVKAITDENGYFQLKLELGTWTLSEVLQDGWTAVTPSEFDVVVSQPFQCEHVRFKNRTEFACVDVYKRDEYQLVGLPGWIIVLQPAFGGAAQNGTTDGTGWVRFNGLTPGHYDITEIQQPGWVSVTMPSVRVELKASGKCAVITFVNRQANAQHPAQPTEKPHYYGNNNVGTGCYTTYTVKAGDNLFRIARNHGVPLQRVRDANNLNGTNTIWAGMKLCIPNK